MYSWVIDTLVHNHARPNIHIIYIFNYFEKLSDEQKKSITALAEVLYANDEKVFPVIGDKENIKITTLFDLVLAKL